MKTALWLCAGIAMLLSIAPLLAGSVSGQSAPAKTPELLGKGKKIYEEKCASCHGAQGNGQTPMAKILKPPPRDFTQPLKNWTASQGEPGKMFKVIAEGIPGTGMVKFNLAQEDVWALVYTVLEFSR